MCKSMQWVRESDRLYHYEDESVSATLMISHQLIDSVDLAPQVYRYRQHRVRIIDKRTGAEDICSHPATGDSVNEEIAWANRAIQRYLSETRLSE